MATIYLALGSNVGDRASHISSAIVLLKENIDSIRQAPIYESKAVGYTQQSNFLNTVIVGQTDLRPEELLKFIKAVEKQVGRKPTFMWGPREIDIDIIFYDDLVIDKEKLVIPHPRFKDRDFVLKPLSDLDPEIIDPLSKVRVVEILENLAKDKLSIIY